MLIYYCSIISLFFLEKIKICSDIVYSIYMYIVMYIYNYVNFYIYLLKVNRLMVYLNEIVKRFEEMKVNKVLKFSCRKN